MREKKEEKKKKEQADVIGIAMASLIKKDDSYRILRGRVTGLGYSPDARLMPYLELAGFGSAALTRMFDLRLLIDGDAIPGVSAIAEPAALCYSLLGASPGDADSTFSELIFTWLKANFQHLSVNASEEELVCPARVYIMHIIGAVLMPNSNNNKPDAVNMGGCLILLQSWALYRMPFLTLVSHQPYVFSLVNRWSIYPGIGRSYTVLIYRLMIEQHAGEGFQCSRVVPRGSSTTTVWLHPVYPESANTGKGGSRHQQERETWTALGGYALEICCGVGESDGSKTLDGYVFQFATIIRVHTMVLCMGKPYLLGGQSTIVPPHVQRSGAYEPVASIEPDPQSNPEPDLERKPEPEAEFKR
ncbi:hypothetical protein CXB51_035664 [Gossypium anomalum]|uniref:Aminotransferase-like plant mobile domain-containing protein n=1 Tax=Gossypium anomalum TaxID=47600 RepID=A0A8J6CKH7_9ROSI|nr:hypothetical protein CXB51_035664 [Gossypium anomalum]